MARKKATSKTPSGKRRSSRIKDIDAKNDISKLPSDLKKLVEDESLTLKQARTRLFVTAARGEQIKLRV